MNKIERLVALTKRADRSEAELCNLLDLSPKRLGKLVEEARAGGYAVALHAGFVGRPPSRPTAGDKTVILPTSGEQRIFAVASDIHVGSKHFMKDAFQDFVHRAYDAGVRRILGPGDILDGVYRFSRWEQNRHGFEDQAQCAAEVFPRLKGLSYEMILGNHDETFEDSSGMSVQQSLADLFRRAGRGDLNLHGSRGAYLRLLAKGERRGLLVELWHPRGSGAYALSYKLQRHIEGYAVGQKPDVVLTGHWHQSCYFTTRGVHALTCGTWQGGGSSFGKSIGGAPSIGGWVIRYSQTKDGTVRDFAPTWHAYYEREEPRTIHLG